MHSDENKNEGKEEKQRLKEDPISVANGICDLSAQSLIFSSPSIHSLIDIEHAYTHACIVFACRFWDYKELASCKPQQCCSKKE